MEEKILNELFEKAESISSELKEYDQYIVFRRDSILWRLLLPSCHFKKRSRGKSSRRVKLNKTRQIENRLFDRYFNQYVECIFDYSDTETRECVDDIINCVNRMV